MSYQMSLFDGNQPLKITKPIRLIELFAGIGAQAKALERLGANFERYRICEFDKYAVASYNRIHGTNFETSDITQIKADDLGIVDTDKYCYVVTYSFPCTDLSKAGQQKGMEKGSGTRSGTNAYCARRTAIRRRADRLRRAKRLHTKRRHCWNSYNGRKYT